MPRRMVKTNLLRIKDAENLLEYLERENVKTKIIIMVRDPRGIMNSRKQSFTCELDIFKDGKIPCENVQDVCHDLDEDVTSGWLTNRI